MIANIRVPVRLKWKFLIGILGLVLLFGGIHIYLLKIRLSKDLGEELRFRLQTYASSIARTAMPLLLLDEKVELHKLLLDARREEPRISYIVILDPSGLPILHTFGPQGIPEELLTANELSPDQSAHYQRLEDARRLYHTFLDIAYPLGMDAKLGTLRIGMDEQGIRHTINRIVMSFLFMVLAFMVVGAVGAFILSWWINQPIKEIKSNMDRFDLSSASPEINVRTGDELEDFAQGVEAMMKRLKSTNEQMDLLRLRMFRAERLMVIGTLAGSIAHEIRNPLAGVINCLNRLSKNPDEENIRKYLPLMGSATQHIEETISRFLHASRMPKKERRDFPVNQAVETALSLVRTQLESKSIQTVAELSDGLPLVSGDHTLLQQVLLNLLVNAIDAIEGEGRILIKSFCRNGHIVIEVQDTGKGISDEELGHLFEPFFSTKGGKGTGLGLAVSQEILKEFNGCIRVESQAGKGSTFRIELPGGD